ncbi:MAG TPA: response regulator [Candidatus Polarisedimenticolaceae bacterium]|nr:response regulator [Candidatus Polarisedimenticolaceae bacterium]
MATPTILVVEDNPITSKMVRVSLESAGLRVLEAGDAATALDLAGRYGPALALLDLFLPDMDGVELCRQLRARPEGEAMPIIAVSGLQSKLEHARTLEAGFSDYLFKPVEPSRIVELVHSYLPSVAGERQDRPGRNRRVLLVDDDAVQRKLNRLQLEDAGFAVTESEDGIEALELAREAAPDVILTDVLMPRMNGFELCLAARRDVGLAHVPIVLSSSTMQSLETADRQMARELGANAFVPRHPGLEEVIEALANSLSTGPPPRPAPHAQALTPKYVDRFLRQVKIQAGLNYTLTQRTALDSVLLSIMTSTVEVVASKLSLQQVLDQVLVRVLDAGGVSAGAIYLVEDGAVRLRAQLGYAAPQARADDFFGRLDLLQRVIDGHAHGPVQLPGDGFPASAVEGLLAAAQTQSMAIAPLVSRGETLGALVMMTGRPELEAPWLVSAGAVAAHLAQAVALSRTLDAAGERARTAELNAEISGALRLGTSFRDMLQRCCAALVTHLDAAFARIWVLNEESGVLELQASAGMYTHLDGPHSRVPVGQFKIGLIAQERQPHLTNAVIGDPRVGDQAWAAREGMTAFAGYPLIVDDRLVGVLAMFSREPLASSVFEALASIADGIAVGIRRRRGDELVRQLTVAVEQSPAAVMITDPEGRIEYVNECFCRTTGYATADVLGRTPALLKSGVTPPEVYRELWANVKAGREWHGELQNRKRDGSLFWNSVSISPVRDVSGRIAKFIAVEEDISRQKRDVEALRASEERFRQLAENIEEVFFVMDADYRETQYISPAYEKVWGVPCRTLYENPSSFLDPIPPADRERMLANIARLQHGEEPGAMEFRVVPPDGRTRWLLSHAVPVRNERGEVYRISGVALDITERKTAEEALRASERRLRTLFETVNLIVLSLDAAGNVDYVNPFFLELTGFALDEVVGSNWFERFVPGGRSAELLEVFSQLMASEQHPHYRNPILTKAGEERSVAWHNTVLRDAEGRPIGTLSIGEDVTEHARLESQLRQAQKMEAVGRLAGGVAHDFNNLLTVIVGHAELSLKGLRTDDPLERHVQEIRKASERAAALTRQLLAFSRQQVLAPRVLDLNELVAGIEKMLRRLLGEDIQLVSTLAPQLGRVKADPGQLEQVVVNLAVNARDAMPDGGMLFIETSNRTLEPGSAGDGGAVPPGSYVVLKISDTGHGMDEKTQARIFEPFFTTKEAGKGTGLGLATVYGIVQQSGGFIGLRSEPGKGATFTVHLPRVEQAVEALPAAAAPAANPTGTETVLLVEDEEGVRTLARAALAQSGYRVLEAANGGEALLLCERHASEIHLMVTDVVMPGMGGPELVRRLATLRPKMKVLFMSGYADRGLERAGVEAGLAFLEKPFRPAALIRKVRDTLDAA